MNGSTGGLALAIPSEEMNSVPRAVRAMPSGSISAGTKGWPFSFRRVLTRTKLISPSSSEPSESSI